ncbi:MAG: hypothetical protein QM765_01425 [Myxococcales bacterium]
MPLTFKALLLAALDLLLTVVVTVTVVRVKEHLSGRARFAFFFLAWAILLASIGAAALVGPGAVVGAGHSLQSMVLWLAGLACFMEVAAVRAAADWKDLEPAARRNRALSLGVMAALFVGLALWTVLT